MCNKQQCSIFVYQLKTNIQPFRSTVNRQVMTKKGLRVSFKGWTWDTTDLLQCKNALHGLLREYSPEELEGLDFGSLDVGAAIDEYFYPAD